MYGIVKALIQHLEHMEAIGRHEHNDEYSRALTKAIKALRNLLKFW